MADSWEDDWEAVADNLGGAQLNDDDKFAGEDEEVEDDWDTPAPQPRKVVVNKYAAKDAVDDARAAAATAIDGTDKAAIERAQQEAELRMMRDMVNGSGASPSTLDTVVPKSNAEFDDYAKELVAKYGTVHKGAKQYKFFVKAIVRLLLEPLDKDGVKDVELEVGRVRSDRMKKERELAAAAKKGPKKTVRVDDDIAVGLDAVTYKGYGDADDDLDFM